MTMSKIQIGDLTERITLQYFTVAKDAMGGRPKTWNDVVTVWASVEPLSLTNLGSSGAREYFYAQQIRAEVVYKVNIRYYPGIQNSWRLKWDETDHADRGRTGKRRFSEPHLPGDEGE